MVVNKNTWLIVAMVSVFLVSTALAQPAETPVESKSLFDFVQAGGLVGYVLILLSIAAIGMVIDGFVRLQTDKLLPPSLIEQSSTLAKQGKFREILAMAKTHDSMLGRVLSSGMNRGDQGLPAIREGLQEHGTREITQLQQRVGYIGLLAAIAPMLGLLGTVTGMVSSFNVLGMAKGTAQPDQLAVGISEALVTTCIGLVIALPLSVFHGYLRNRVTRIGQDTAGICERLLHSMTCVVESRNSAGRTQTSQQGSPGATS